MKIGILSPFYPYRGGLAQLNARLYIELSKNNEVKAYTFTTLYPEFLFPGKTQFVEEGDTATKIDSIRVLNTVNPLSYVKTAKSINRFAPDILIIPYWMTFFAPAFGIISMLLNKKTKVVSLVHNAIPHERRIIDKPFSRFFFNRCDAFIVMSEPVETDLLSLKKNANVVRIDHPIYDHYGERIHKAEACSQLGIDPNKKTLLFFGLIRDYKGLDILIESMNLLDDSYQLLICGEPYGSFEKYQKLIDESHFKENIFVFGQYIHDDMVPVFFSAADVLVLPYRSATQSGVVTLAYQLELPMLGTDVGALGSAIAKSETGMVIPSVTIDGVAKCIVDFFGTADRSHYTKKLKKEKDRLSWDNFAKSIESFISNLPV